MKHNYTTEDLLLFVSGEGADDWRNELRENLFEDSEMLLQFREVKKWDRFLSRLRIRPSARSLDSVKEYARQSMIVALC